MAVRDQNETLTTIVTERQDVADGIVALELRRPSNGEFPAFTAGSHIDLHLPNGLVRSYSLVNSPRERDRYCIAVNLDRGSRGGSAFVHASLYSGMGLEISYPRNNFELIEDGKPIVFIVGGIGITPIVSMVERLSEAHGSWRLHYCARSRKGAAFVAEIQGKAADAKSDAHFHFDDEMGGQLMSVQSAVDAAPADAHLYCCGPDPLLRAFDAATQSRPKSLIHVERFSADLQLDKAKAFTVKLARCGRSFQVPPDKSILAVLLEAGVQAPHSCMQGVCGTCETGVLAGIPDHRDLVLTEKERATGRVVMICCARALSDELVLDL
jgi:tetrachlorobenzoquinone reductase